MSEQTPHDEGLTDDAFGRAIAIGVLVGLAMMFLVTTGMVFVGGQSLAISAGIAVWVAFVIGPYAGGLAMLSRAESRSHRTPVALLPSTTEEDEQAAA